MVFRPANILVGHLSTIAILFAFLSVLLLAESVKIVDLSGYGMCELVSFSKSKILQPLVFCNQNTS